MNDPQFGIPQWLIDAYEKHCGKIDDGALIQAISITATNEDYMCASVKVIPKGETTKGETMT